MLVISIQFLSGAYHATPWGKHVNEGIAEWPPSPWRLLRALISVWKTKHHALEEAQLKPLFTKLASEAPSYQLPDASVSHTKHYMPDNKSRNLILDTFIVTGKKPTYIIWKDIELDQTEKEHLAKLLDGLHYFGRAESWCRAELKDRKYEIVEGNADTSSQICINCRPLDGEMTDEQEIIRVLVPYKEIDLTDLHTGTPSPSSITVTTAILQDKRRPYLDPPGARWIKYVRPQNFFKERQPASQNAMRDGITLVRYAVAGNVRPSIKDTMRIGDIARNACISRHQKETGDRSSIFLGKDEGGMPYQNHKHASYLPTYETQRHEIDHLTIIAAGGFGKTELNTLIRLKKIYRYNGIGAQLVFQGIGTVEDFPDIPILKESKKWVSATPLILSRHVKYKRGRVVEGPEYQIRREIEKKYAGFKIDKVRAIQAQTGINGTDTKPSEFFRWRRHGSVGSSTPYVVGLEFKEAVRGPITLGYGAHFGLGMFVPDGGKK